MMMPSYNSCLAYFYYFEKNVDKNTLNRINNSCTGQRNLGEKIKVKIIDEEKIKNKYFIYFNWFKFIRKIDKMKKILIAGGSGLVGTSLTQLAVKKNIKY